MTTTTATFPSRCAACQHPIHRGADIVKTEKRNRWKHANCDNGIPRQIWRRRKVSQS